MSSTVVSISDRIASIMATQSAISQCEESNVRLEAELVKVLDEAEQLRDRLRSLNATANQYQQRIANNNRFIQENQYAIAKAMHETGGTMLQQFQRPVTKKPVTPVEKRNAVSMFKAWVSN